MDSKPLNLHGAPLTMSSPIIKHDVITSSAWIIPNVGFLLKSFSAIVLLFCVSVFLLMQCQKSYTEVPQYLCCFLSMCLNSNDTKKCLFQPGFVQSWSNAQAKAGSEAARRHSLTRERTRWPQFNQNSQRQKLSRKSTSCRCLCYREEWD